MSGVLSEPSTGHPDGEATFVFDATTPAVGLLPQETKMYLQTVDVETGKTVQVVTPTPTIDATGSPLALYSNSNIVTISNKGMIYTISTQSGRITNKISSTLQIWSVGEYLVGMPESTDAPPCTSTVYDAVTLSTVSLIPDCGDQVAGLEYPSAGGSSSVNFTPPLTDGYVQFLQPANFQILALKAYSLATGQPAPVSVATSGPRSTIALQWTPDPGGNSSTAVAPDSGLKTYEIADWSAAFSIPASQANQLSLNIFGVADNDIWVSTTNQNLVIDGSNGKTLQNSWSYTPDFGVNGWTVVSSDQQTTVGSPPQYLVRYAGPLESAINTGPSTSSNN